MSVRELGEQAKEPPPEEEDGAPRKKPSELVIAIGKAKPKPAKE
jgi:hypothetical protein